MKRILITLLAATASFCLHAQQSTPGFVNGQVPTAAQWNSYFAVKLDYNPGGLPASLGGTGNTTLSGPLKGNGTAPISSSAAADIYGLWSGTCSSSTFLRGDGACATAGTGTVNSGTINQFAYYAAAGNVISGISLTGYVKGNGASVMTASATVPLSDLATQATNTVVGNATGGSAAPIALAVGGCSSASSALIWTTNTGFGCNTSITANTASTASTLATPRAIYGNNFDGSAALTQVIAGTYGGTGTAYFTVTGPTVARSFAFPDQDATILYSGGALGTPSSGVATNLTGTASGLTAGTATALATPRAIYGNNFDGSAALTQIIASTYGGTGNGFAKFTGPASSEKSFALPNANATILTDNTAVTVPQGGSGRATGTTAYALIATGTTATGAQQTLANGATTEILVGGGASALPAWTAATGSGAPVRQVSPTLTNPAITVQVLGVTSTPTWTLSSGNMGTAALVNSITPTITVSSTGSAAFLLTQAGSGSYTVTWPSNVYWASGTAPTLSTTVGKSDMVTCNTFDGTNLICASLLDVHH